LNLVKNLKDGTYSLVYFGKSLENNTKITEIANEGIIYCVYRQHGGAEVTFKADVYNKLKSNDINCMDKYEDHHVEKIKMPCGHSTSALYLLKHTKESLGRGQVSIRCPKIIRDDINNKQTCGTKWSVEFIFKALDLDADTSVKIQEKLNENFMPSNGVISCKKCGSLLLRKSKSDIHIICPNCTLIKGYTFEICYYCSSEWKNPKCSNETCIGDHRLRILRECGLKGIGTGANAFSVPKMRACVKCGIVIEHSDFCKHMTCPICECEFCFSCLKTKGTFWSRTSWGCGGPYEACTVAPIQTVFNTLLR